MIYVWLLNDDIFAQVKYGGHGYSHILANAVPHMLRRGIKQEEIDKMLIETPRKWLAFEK